MKKLLHDKLQIFKDLWAEARTLTFAHVPAAFRALKHDITLKKDLRRCLPPLAFGLGCSLAGWVFILGGIPTASIGLVCGIGAKAAGWIYGGKSAARALKIMIAHRDTLDTYLPENHPQKIPLPVNDNTPQTPAPLPAPLSDRFTAATNDNAEKTAAPQNDRRNDPPHVPPAFF